MWIKEIIIQCQYLQEVFSNAHFFHILSRLNVAISLLNHQQSCVWWESMSYYVTTSRLGSLRVSGNDLKFNDIRLWHPHNLRWLLWWPLNHVSTSLSTLCYATTHVQPRLQKQRHHEESAIILPLVSFSSFSYSEIFFTWSKYFVW